MTDRLPPPDHYLGAIGPSLLPWPKPLGDIDLARLHFLSKREAVRRAHLDAAFAAREVFLHSVRAAERGDAAAMRRLTADAHRALDEARGLLHASMMYDLVESWP